jgi:hypothetical protein
MSSPDSLAAKRHQRLDFISVFSFCFATKLNALVSSFLYGFEYQRQLYIFNTLESLAEKFSGVFILFYDQRVNIQGERTDLLIAGGVARGSKETPSSPR